MELINRKDIEYKYYWGFDGLTECVSKEDLEAMNTAEGVYDSDTLFALTTSLHYRALNSYKKAVKARQTYDLIGDPAEKDKALRYEGYADGLTKAVHYIEELINRKVEE
jgi:hypothetical protein